MQRAHTFMHSVHTKRVHPGTRYVAWEGKKMDWSGNKALRDAARDGDFGRVIRHARKALGLTQRQLGEACGLSQSAMSRLEDRGVGTYNMTLLASAASHLGIP